MATGRPGDRGFTLVEVVVAIVVLSTAAVAAAGLFAIAAQSTRAARVQTWTALLAADKLEQLRSLAWTGLNPSPADSLERDVAGYVDYLDGSGRSVGSGSGPSARAVYVRRWNVQPLPEDPTNTLILQVLVTSVVQSRRAAPGTARLAGRAGGALVASLRTRKGQQ